MAWLYVDKALAADFAGVKASFLKDEWSDAIEALIRNEYKYHLNISSFTEYYSGDGTNLLFLKKTPIVSLTNVSIIGPSSLTSVILNDYFITHTKFIEMTSGVFPEGHNNIVVEYTGGVDGVDPRVQFAEMACLAYLVKFLVGNRGEDTIKFASAPAIGTNQFSPRPGVVKKMQEIIRDIIPSPIRFK
jgi:hypothetical protein